MSTDERQAFEHSDEVLRAASERIAQASVLQHAGDFHAGGRF